MSKDLPFVVSFHEVCKEDVAIVGGKGANLGELTQAGFSVPPGFIVTAAAYFHVLKINKLVPKIKAILADHDLKNIKSLNSVSAQIKKLILNSPIPEEISLPIIKKYLSLGHGFSQSLVAVRSSATAEDLPDASFAGQQETFLNIKGEANVVQNVRRCWASLFEPRAIFYREEKGYGHFNVGVAVPVQKMVESKISGIMFTVNPISNDKNQIVIEAIWGLGEQIVQGIYTPDHYLVQKLSWKILQKQVNPQTKQLILVNNKNQEVKINKKNISRPKLTDQQIITLAKLGHKIQQHYFFPQDVEWAFEKNKCYLVQSRPITTIQEELVSKNSPTITGKLILKGESASPGIVSGFVRILSSAREINQLKPQEILVTDMTTPDFVPAMKKAAAIVTNKGGQTSHAAIVSRELGIPCIVGTGTATKILTSGKVITVNGITGQIFSGGHLTPSKIKLASPKKPLAPNPKKFVADFFPTATKVYVNLGEPDLAAATAQKNVDGVGLLRAEFMIAQIGIHPKKLIADGKTDKFISSLVDGLTKFAKAFYPRPVVYRATDFKTNEYSNLIGGKAYEPTEFNPMIGYRGAFRYIHDQKVFDLELKALTIARNHHDFKNLWLMIPFVRTVQELISVKKIVSAHGLVRSPSFQLWMMAEIPSNVILLEDFLDVGLDGISIGSNDLTMLTLGVDRDNSEVASEYDELNPAVLKSLEKIITTCKTNRVSCSICGQAPSIYPDLTEKLVKWGITSVSVSPDMIDQTRNLIYQAEKKLIHG
ncbi:MAG: phosphoenolpyruvate synthase [Candidatus Beckwithbacteria bacterium]|nr:phosphoenolpyruvate synthase [Candidatus Beckwithbacteria bacterium]